MLKSPTSVLRGTARHHCGRFAASALGLALLVPALWLSVVDFAIAHHVLGRPNYSLNEDSNTPPSMQGEVQIGDYFVTYMAFPAFPRPRIARQDQSLRHTHRRWNAVPGRGHFQGAR